MNINSEFHQFSGDPPRAQFFHPQITFGVQEVLIIALVGFIIGITIGKTS